MKGLSIYILCIVGFWACLAAFAIACAARHICNELARDRQAQRLRREVQNISIHGGQNG